MPAARTNPSKQRGTPKAKGAVRAKSGCYTCRIRRKKCDEELSDGGRCRTCVRLRLECLGFGPKRPEWLREIHNVREVREKIKNFLASHGMIKGHTGTALPRESEYELPTLRLSDETSGSESSQSPTTPTLSLTSETMPCTSDDRTHSHIISLHRGEQSWDGSATPPEYPGINFTTTILRSDSPYSSQESNHDQSLYPLALECYVQCKDLYH